MEHENSGWLWWRTGTIWLLQILAAFPHSHPEWGKALHITGLPEWSFLLFFPWRLITAVTVAQNNSARKPHDSLPCTSSVQPHSPRPGSRRLTSLSKPALWGDRFPPLGG